MATGDDVDPTLGISRRRLLRRGLAAGGALVWTAPVVQTLAVTADEPGSAPSG